MNFREFITFFPNFDSYIYLSVSAKVMAKRADYIYEGLCRFIAYNTFSIEAGVFAKMKINIQNNYNLYKNKLGENSVGKAAYDPSSRVARADTNAIAKGSTKLPDKQMLGVKSSTQSYVAAPADSERLASLKAGIQSGAYRIDTADLVSVLMDD
ncbi:hypothetical protein FACS1894191_8690 [Clostridia bacterium]|nr:hypothetical protein FACS1894191_8690 [Clostridia bacterium]